MSSELWRLGAVELAGLVRAGEVSALAVPTGTAVVDGVDLPQGVQIIGPRYREDLCLDAAQAIEDRLGVLAPIDPR